MAVSHRGAISFGLVHIPVGLYTATQDNDMNAYDHEKPGNLIAQLKRAMGRTDLIH